MAALFYAVTAALPSNEIAAEYVGWLEAGHVQDVIAGGASEARIVRLDDESDGVIRIETQYTFPSRGAFQYYEKEHAPALREIGRDRFASRGVAFERRVGSVEFG